jgi:hypothetical protein
MTISDKCIIDNWSLEQTACLFETDSLETFPSEELFINSLGGLSNFINAMLLYDDTKFIANGFQTGWYRYDWFKKNATLHIKPYIPDDFYLDWNNHIASNSLGTNHYLLTSKYLEADLFISPDRAKRILEQKMPLIDNTFIDILTKIDKNIQAEKNSIWSDKVKVGIDQNFILPSLTQFVFSQASSLDELLTIIMQLKGSNEIAKLKTQIQSLTESTKDFTKFQNEIENIIKDCFGKPNKSEKPWALKISVLFLTLTKSFNLDFIKRQQYSTFLKDVITCRSEAFRLKNDIDRIFKRKINLT